MKEYEFPPDGDGYRYVLMMRPRAGTWNPFICGILEDEKERVAPKISVGNVKRPLATLPPGSILWDHGEGTVELQGQKYWCFQEGSGASPSRGYFMTCKEWPSQVEFGEVGQGPSYAWKKK